MKNCSNKILRDNSILWFALFLTLPFLVSIARRVFHTHDLLINSIPATSHPCQERSRRKRRVMNKIYMESSPELRWCSARAKDITGLMKPFGRLSETCAYMAKWSKNFLFSSFEKRDFLWLESFFMRITSRATWTLNWKTLRSYPLGGWQAFRSQSNISLGLEIEIATNRELFQASLPMSHLEFPDSCEQRLTTFCKSCHTRAMTVRYTRPWMLENYYNASRHPPQSSFQWLPLRQCRCRCQVVDFWFVISRFLISHKVGTKAFLRAALIRILGRLLSGHKPVGIRTRNNCKKDF